jgi:uncharacterized protein YbjT (DUF2867 family)
MPYHNNGPLLVTGAAGRLGRRVIHHLLATHGVPAGQVIAVTRKPEALAGLAARGVLVRQGSFDDPAGLKSVFAGAKLTGRPAQSVPDFLFENRAAMGLG